MFCSKQNLIQFLNKTLTYQEFCRPTKPKTRQLRIFFKNRSVPRHPYMSIQNALKKSHIHTVYTRAVYKFMTRFYHFRFVCPPLFIKSTFEPFDVGRLVQRQCNRVHRNSQLAGLLQYQRTHLHRD